MLRPTGGSSISFPTCTCTRLARAPALIHGHTHRPADQALDAGHTRHVLTDWDVEANPPRAGVLRLQAQPDGAVSLDRITPDQAG